MLAKRKLFIIDALMNDSEDINQSFGFRCFTKPHPNRENSVKSVAMG
jgi:hypothetical protein